MSIIIHRFIKKQVSASLKPGRVTGLFGARRTGKTFLMNEIRNDLSGKKLLFVDGENLDVSEILSSQRLSTLGNLLNGYEYLLIDEAQMIPDIGVNLKLIVDNFPNISVFVSGSSSFELKNKIGEPLTGRSVFYHLYPIAQMELNEDFIKSKSNLETRLIFGSYPQVIIESNLNEKKDILKSITDGYLLKDILEFESRKDSVFILNLLRLIAFQVGNDISYSELASNLKVNSRTVIKFLNLLEKTFILFSLPGFSRNLRKEYSKTPRYYFCDNGIRNSIISNYNFLNSRDDIGKLWENYCITERIKKLNNLKKSVNFYFWRTYDKKEIDLIEEEGGKLNGYEFKWSQDKTKLPKEFLENYKNSNFSLINNSNYYEFIS